MSVLSMSVSMDQKKLRVLSMSVSVECGVWSVEYDSAVSGEPPYEN
jgi:hypothetical protein